MWERARRQCPASAAKVSFAGKARRAAKIRFASLLAAFLICSSLAQPESEASAQAPSPVFEVASVRQAPAGADPNTGTWSRSGGQRFNATHVSLALLIRLAYGIDDSQISRKPDWLETHLYDIAAKAEDGVDLTRENLRPRLQALLQQRFHLQVHTEQGQNRGYALEVASGGPHLTPTKAEQFPGFRIDVSTGQMRGLNWSTAQFAAYLTSAAGFPVVDHTGLSGSYDIGFSYAATEENNSELPQLADAVRRATGLLLKPQKVPVTLYVIDSAQETPTDN